MSSASPGGGGHTLSIADLIDIGRLQHLFDGLSATVGVSLTLVDPHAATLVTAGWQDICADFHRVHPQALAGCLDSELRSSEHVFRGTEAPTPAALRCANGLRGVAFPVVVAGDRLATVFASQFLYDDEEIDLASFRERARRFGFDEAAYLDALARVPVLSRDSVARVIGLVGDLVAFLTDLGLGALRREREHEALRESEERYRQLFEAESDAVFLIDNETGRIMEANGAAAAMYGYSRDELLALTNADLSAEPEQTQAVTHDTPIAAETVVTIPLRIHHRKDGSQFPVEITGRFFMRRGRPVHVAAIRDISARLATEEALRLSEDKFAKAFHGSPDSVLITRVPDGRIVEVNDSFTTITGHSRQEALGKTTSELGLWADPRSREHYIALFEDGGGVRDLELDVRVKSGEVRRGAISSALITINGQSHVLSIVRDVTEQRRAEEAVRRSEAQLRGILDNLQDAYVRADEQGLLQMVSTSAARLFGYGSPDEMIGLPAQDLYADPAGRRAVFGQLRQRGHVVDFVGRALRKDGSTFWASFNAQLVHDDDLGAGSEGFVRDISERIEAERALRESEDRFKYVFDHSTVGMSLMLPSGELLTNEAGARMLGYTREELAQLRWQDVTHPDDMEKTQRSIEILMSGTPAVRFKKRYIHKDGSLVWADASSSLRLDDEGRPLHLLTSMVDITERERAAEEIRRLNAELEARVHERTAELKAANQELEAANRELESFAYSVSHDLRQPLRALDGFSQILLDDYGATLDEAGRAHLERIIAADKRMGALIDALLDLSRLNRGDLARESLDLSALARSVAAELSEAEPERDVELVIADGLMAGADRRLARSLLANLLDNAWKFTARHGSARIEVGAEESDGETVFFVCDDGAGFDMAYSGKLFGAFQSLHSPGEFDGLGIGLATVQRIVRRHGGRVWAEGEVEKGATFFFTLPSPAAGGLPG